MDIMELFLFQGYICSVHTSNTYYTYTEKCKQVQQKSHKKRLTVQVNLYFTSKTCDKNVPLRKRNVRYACTILE